MPMDPKMLAGMLGGAAGAPDSAPTDDPTDDKGPDPIQAAFDALRAAVDEAEKTIMTTEKDEGEPEDAGAPPIPAKGA